MADQELKFILEGDAAGAVAAFQKLEQKTSETSAALDSAQTEANRLGQTFAESEAKTNSLAIQWALGRKALQELGESAGKTSGEYATLKAEIGEMEAAYKRQAVETKSLEKSYGSAQIKAAELQAALAKQRDTLSQSSGNLEKAGIDVNNLAKEYERLKVSAEVGTAFKALDVKPIEQQRAEIARLEQAYQTLKNSGTVSAAELSRAHEAMKAKIAELDPQVSKTSGLMTSLGTAAASALAAFGVTEAIHRMKEYATEIGALQVRLQGLTRNSEEYAQTEAFLTDLAEKHHRSQMDLSQAYIKMLAIQEENLVSSRESQQILEGLDNAAVKLGLSTEDVSGMLDGFGRAMQSPVIGMRELRSVVMPIPGLLANMDQASGQAAGGFKKLVSEGKITAETFKEVLIRALQNYEGAAEKAGGTIAAKSADISNSWEEVGKKVTPIFERIYGLYADLQINANRALAETYSSWAKYNEMLDKNGIVAVGQNIKAAFLAIKEAITGSSESAKAAAESDKEFAAVQEKIAQEFGNAAKEADKFKTAIDPLRDSITGLKDGEQITLAVLDGLKTKWNEARLVAESRALAVKSGLATQQEYDLALSASKKAEADYTLELKKAADQLASQQKVQQSAVAAMESAFTTRQNTLQSQIASAAASAKEAEAAGKHIDALTFERDAIAKAGELRQLEINNAWQLINARKAQVQAAENNLALIERTANADGLLTDAERESIASAQADVAAKRQQAQAARDHVTELSRLPASLNAIVNAQAMESAEVKKAYNEAFTLIQAAKDRRSEAEKGLVTIRESSKADDAAAVAVAKLTEAVSLNAQAQKADAAAIADRADTEKRAMASVAAERAAHNAAVAAQNAQNRADEASAAAARHAEDQAAIHDGEQLGVVYENSGAILASFGEKGKKAIREYAESIENIGSQLGYQQWVRYVNEWVQSEKEQEDQLQKLTDGMKRAMATGEGLARYANMTTAGFDKLDDEKLNGLRAAIEAARAKMQALNDESKSTLQGIQDELYQLEGNARASEEMRYQNKLAELQAKLQQANKAGARQAISDLQQALQLEEQIHTKKMANISQEQMAKLSNTNVFAYPGTAEAGTAAAAPKPERTVRLELATPAGVIPATVNSEHAAILDKLAVSRRSAM